MIRRGRGRAFLNVLDPSRRWSRPSGSAPPAIRALADEVEEALLDQAILLLDRRVTDQQPVLADLLAVVQEAPTELRRSPTIVDQSRTTSGLPAAWSSH